MHKHLEKMGEITFDKIFNQKLGELFWSGSLYKNIYIYIHYYQGFRCKTQ